MLPGFSFFSRVLHFPSFIRALSKLSATVTIRNFNLSRTCTTWQNCGEVHFMGIGGTEIGWLQCQNHPISHSHDVWAELCSRHIRERSEKLERTLTKLLPKKNRWFGGKWTGNERQTRRGEKKSRKEGNVLPFLSLGLPPSLNKKTGFPGGICSIGIRFFCSSHENTNLNYL